MDKLDRAVASAVSPLFNEWRLKANLTSDEAAAFWFKDFETLSVLQISFKMNYSESSVKRLYNRARLKILKIL